MNDIHPMQELIHRRRRQVLVHSILYYSYSVNLIPDSQFDSWAQELARLQREFPEHSEAVEYQLEAFRDFTGETGFHLPLHDKDATRIAKQLRTGTG